MVTSRQTPVKGTACVQTKAIKQGLLCGCGGSYAEHGRGVVTHYMTCCMRAAASLVMVFSCSALWLMQGKAQQRLLRNSPG